MSVVSSPGKAGAVVAGRPSSGRSAKVGRLLAELSAAGDPTRRRQLRTAVILASLPVARSVAARYRGRGVDQHDLEQIAALGLVKAVRRWKPGLSDDFLQFAVPTITGEIKRYFRDHWWTVRPPRRLQETRAAMAQFEQDYRQDTGREPGERRTATELGVGLDTVREAKQVRQRARPSSLEAAAEADNGSYDRALATDDVNLRRVEDRLTVQRMLETLSERERTVVQLRFFRSWSQAKIGERIGVSQMQVSRILRDIYGKLRLRWEN
ncbi:sigma-70 family RNA polymerase sigma factor [Nakamurella lactea]|uniref:sigma-70 family RNA polymerase sigma factor n=1 Tax=Nakamurella lactea TaxID=459515 RepID=UPI0003FDA8FB|nr:sigma-70 family RNA polymerase sigma factor [Nakamurella lactea]